jgi:hypothetical protein
MADYKEITPEMSKKIKAHYMRPEILEVMLSASPDKEVVGSFGGTGYGKRPDTLEYENDITTLVKKGVTSFHISEEQWISPLALAPGMTKKDQNALRKTWDMIIDIDCPHWEICKMITHNLMQEIKNNNVQNVSVKFSGNKGFHIGIPCDSFPELYPDRFPELPRKIAEYLLEKVFVKSEKEMITILKKEFGEDYFTPAVALFKRPKEELFKDGKLNARVIIEVDTLLLSPRHLYRMVYSVNEKSGLVSIPINPDKILDFEKDIAKIENNVFSKFTFLDRTKSTANEAAQLFLAAEEFNAPSIVLQDIDAQMKALDEDVRSQAKRNFEDQKEMIPEEFFPESIKKMLANDLQDGKKRALFVLKNFLSSMGWTYDQVEKRLMLWNAKNAEPLRETGLKGQLMYLKQQMANNQKVFPPNFSNTNYYADIVGTLPEYQKAKNPVSLAIRYFRYAKKDEKKTKPKKTTKKQPKPIVKKEA